MKQVFLMGDSIRLGYEPFVREYTKNQAVIHAPKCNCEFLQYTFRHVYMWRDEIENPNNIDIVHWNNGLWDVLRLDNDQPLTPQYFYRDTLQRTVDRIKFLFPNARIVFALSTPVIERLSPEGLERRNSDIEIYNSIASEVMDKNKIVINDLYKVASSFPETYHTDFTHFTEEGSRELAKAVVRAIGCVPQ